MKTSLLALLVFPIVVAVSWGSHDRQTKNPAQQMAGALSVILPKDLGGGSEMRSAVAEGDTLVITVAMPSSPVLSGSEVAKVAQVGFCQSSGGQRYIGDGGKLRLDVAMGGEPVVKGNLIESCVPS